MRYLVLVFVDEVDQPVADLARVLGQVHELGKVVVGPGRVDAGLRLAGVAAAARAAQRRGLVRAEAPHTAPASGLALHGLEVRIRNVHRHLCLCATCAVRT
jgi:hypothetical protein